MSLLEPLRMRTRTLLRPVRRAVLGRRRLLAALCAGVAVLAGLRASASPPPATVDVPVLARDVGAGAVLTAADVRRVAFTPGSVPAGLVDDPTGRVVATAVGRGEPVTATRLVGASLTGAGDLSAMPVRFPDPAMAGLLRVGDVIDVLAVDPQGGAPAVVARGARVLATPVPPTGAGSSADGLPGRVVVLGVAPADVTGVADASVRLFLTYSYQH